MSSCRTFLPRIPTRNLHSLSPLRLRLTQPLRIPSSSPSQKLFILRAYTTSPPNPNANAKPNQAGKEGEVAQGTNGRKYIFPQRIIIYHAGIGRILFLAILKLTTIAVAVFFCGILVPAFVREEKPWNQTVGLFVAGLIPLAFVGYTTAPLVAFLHMHLPPVARASRANLERFVRSLPPQTRLDATTLSLVGKPRVSYFEAGDLRPASGRFGVIDYARDTSVDNAARKWYMYRAVGKFSLQGGNKGVKEAWIWDALKGRVDRKYGR